jgi:hypothetical protein
MRPDRNLMERVAAADPLPDAERLTPEEEREAEALLARLLATPPEPPEPSGAATRRAPHPRLRRWTLAGVGAAGVAAVAFTAINLGDSESPRTDVVDQAVAARTVAALTHEDSVYHVLQPKRGTGNIPARPSGPFVVESWHSSAGRFHEKVFEVRGGRRGRLVEEVAGLRRPDSRVGPALRYDALENRLHGGGIGRTAEADELPLIDPTGNPGTTLRELEARGALRAAGATRVGGRRAYRLVSDPIDAEFGEQRFEYVVDSETYLPLRQRWSLRRGEEEFGFVSEFLVYERLPLDAHSRAQLDLDRHPGATCAVGAGEVRGKRDLGFANPCPASGREGAARWP